MDKKGPLWWRESDWLLRGSSAANQILLRHSGPILSVMVPSARPPQGGGGAMALEGGTVPVGMDLEDTALEEGMYRGNSPTSGLEKVTALERGMVKGNSFWEGMYGKNVCRCRPLLLQWISEPKLAALFVCVTHSLSVR